MNHSMDVSAHVRPVIAQGPGGSGPLPAYSDGRYDYLADAEMAVLADHLEGYPMTDRSGERIGLTRSGSTWLDVHGRSRTTLREVKIAGVAHYQLDTSTWNPTAKPIING